MGGRNPPSGGAPGDDCRRRYPHVERSQDPVKRSHNDWVVASALEHGTDVLVLDGLDLNTTSLLIRAGVPYDAIHVPNRPDFDALMKRERATFGGGAAGAFMNENGAAFLAGGAALSVGAAAGFAFVRSLASCARSLASFARSPTSCTRSPALNANSFAPSSALKKKLSVLTLT